MLDKLEAVFQFERPDRWVVVFGRLPEADLLAELAKTAQARPSARKVQNGMVITVPLSPQRWMIWQLSEVPPVSDLAAVMARLQDLSRGLERLNGSGPVATLTATSSAPVAGAMAADKLASLTMRLRTALGGLRYPKQAAVAATLLDLLVEDGTISGGMLIEYAGSGVRRHWLSDSRYRSHTAEMRLVAQSARTEDDRVFVVHATGENAETLEAALLARQFDAESIAFLVPAAGAHGYGLCVFDVAEESLPLLRVANDLVTVIVAPRTPATEQRRWLRRGLTAAILAGVAVWLALPAPIAVTATGESVPVDLTVATVPSDAFLKTIHVRPGDLVTNGDILAEFDSPSLRDMLAEERLNATVEALSAQAALAENRYSDYQISTERLGIVNTRIDQINERIAALQIVATVDGKVIEAMPDSVTGAFARVGDQVAAIQTTDAMRMKLAFARMDARLVIPGMVGEVYFRGTAGRTYRLQILTPATVREDPQSRIEVIEAIAEIETPDGVIAGMSGVANLDGPQAPRIVSYGRYAYEFVRRGSWTYLGLKL
ncbi:MAG: hypothetical protein ACRC6I_06825 [Paracoccaceae bacterium]